jgi:glycosyltransferase involved in cell wall biosynthesis
MLQGARFVQALSSEEAQVLHWIAPRARIEVVGNGAYSTKLDSVPTRPATRHPSGSFPHFVYCGRYAIYHKGLDLLIEGFAQYRREGGIGKLTMIGTGPERDTLARVAESLGITDVAEIGGPLFGEARDKALSRCDYFIMASRFEGVPLAALEAALLGMPLVVTEGTGLCSQVKENGAGVPIEALTAEAVCKALHRAAKFSIMEFAACGAAAFALAVAIGDWTAIARRLRVLYEEPNSSSFSIPAPVSARPA